MHLMASRDGPVSSPEAARRSGGTLAEIRGTLRALRTAGLVEAVRGRGYRLARPAGRISVWNIVRAIDPPTEPKAPCGGDWEACAPRASCVLEPLCRHAREHVREALSTYTLADLRDRAPQLPLCIPVA
jgi:Rrf2 family protein